MGYRGVLCVGVLMFAGCVGGEPFESPQEVTRGPKELVPDMAGAADANAPREDAAPCLPGPGQGPQGDGGAAVDASEQEPIIP